MNCKRFLALASIMVVTQANGALEIEIDGQTHFGDEVIVRRADEPPPGNGGNGNDPPPPPPPPPPTNGGDCSGNLTLNEVPLRRGQNRHTMRNGEVTAFRFTEGSVSSSIQFGESTDGRRGRKFLTVSECAGDFDLTGIGPNCSRTGTSGTLWLQFGNGNGNDRRSSFACRLEADGRPYYLNIWYHDPDEGVDTCGGRCGFIVTN